VHYITGAFEGLFLLLLRSVCVLCFWSGSVHCIVREGLRIILLERICVLCCWRVSVYHIGRIKYFSRQLFR